MVGAVMFPHNIGIGATRDPDLSYEQGVITAQETRSSGPHWGFGPAVCVGLDIRWGRTYECFSEDPDLVSLMETMLEGYQGPDPDDLSGMKILATPKHFAGDGATQNGRNAGVVVMSSADFEYWALSPYVPAVQTYHAATSMPSYSSTQLDGAPTPILMSANEELMTGWLKEDVGFEGFLISDWNAIDSIPVPSPNPLPPPIDQNYAYDIMISFNAGMDMVMAPNQPAWKNFINYLQTLVDLNYVSQERVDDAVRRILKQKFALGLFEEPFTDRSTQDQIYSDEHRAVARQTAAESQVLLKNEDNILPLSKTANIYLAGRNADNIINQAGGWSISWQSIPGNMVPAVAPYFTTIRQAVENVVGAGNVTFNETASPAPAPDVYDVGIVVVGENAYAEGSGDVPGSQTNMTTAADATAINNVCSAMPCVVMTVSGRPFMLTDEQFGQAQAVVGSWLPGSEGDGIGDVLFGDMDFTGRLSMSWPWANSQEPINVGDEPYAPRYPYGWGLRTGSSQARLQQTRDSLAAIVGDAHVDAAVAYLDELLGADVWDANGATTDPGYALRLLYLAAEQLAMTDADSFNQTDGVYGAALVIAQASVVADGGPTAVTSPLIADADHELVIDHPDVAVELLAQAVSPIVTAEPALQTVQYSDYVETVAVSAGNAASELPLTASTEWSLDGGAFHAGLPDWLAWTDLGCTADGIWGECAWTLGAPSAVDVPAGTYIVRATVTEGTQANSVDITIEVAQEDAAIEYTGEGFKEVGMPLALRVTVWDSAADSYPGPNPEFPPEATIGDITKMWIAFELSDCDSGAPLASELVQVADTADPGDGIGTAVMEYTSAAEATVCVDASLVGEDGGVNEWYTAEGTEATLIFYTPSKQSATGGGWIYDPDGGTGNFGATVRYLTKGRVQGNLNYKYSGIFNGEVADFQIKSDKLNAVTFDSSQSPTALLQGSATLLITRASDGAVLWSDDNATLQAALVDGDVDALALMAYDYRGVPFKRVPSTPLQGGSIVIHK
jgi:beta-glucosidase